MFSLKKNKQSGFTLIELMVVMAIIAILATAGLSAYTGYIDKARVTKVGEFARNVHTGLADKLLLKLDFDEGTMTDVSGYNHNGTCTETACPTVDTGYNGKGAYKFDGVNDIINVGIGSDFFPMPTFTICSWIKTPGLAAGMTSNGIISMTYGLTLYINGSGRLTLSFDNGAAPVVRTYVIAPSNSNLYTNKFHHVCGAYDGTQGHIYIDGVMKKSTAGTWTGTSYWSSNPVNIGTNNNDSIYKFNGIIDDVRFYSGSLLAGDIEKMYRESVFKYLAQR